MAVEMEGPLDISTEIYHLKELSLYSAEKPYTMRYMPDGSIPATNVVREKHNIHVCDIRGNKQSYTLRQHGFAVADIDTRMKYEDFENPQKIRDTYLPDLEKLLGKLFPGSDIDFVSYLIRKRDATFPISTGTRYPHGQPNIVAHIDATASDLARQIQRRFPSPSSDSDSDSGFASTTDIASAHLAQRCQYITLWKPLRGPLYDWPLALCDGNSVDEANDLQPQDIVDRDEVLENVHVYHREGHRWYYLNGQRETEVLVFRQADTRAGGFGTPHCAIANPNTPEDALPRESIEVVAFVYGGD